MDTTTRAESSPRTSVGAVLLARWPTLVGLLALAGSSADGPDAHITAMVIILAATCYLGAAALGSRRSGWVLAVAASVLVAVGVTTDLDATAALLVGAALLALVGLLRWRRVDRRELGLQAAGFVVFTAIALTAMMVGPLLAAHLAALAALGHGAWDVVHHRRDRVVTRSLAEFCAVLDIGLGVVLLVATWVAVLS
ncbi:hypothetical protein DT076_08835 [Desertihabitans brevis]|uniref:Uncharacterized protein n=1 Tax=Desertihabitans brevis TaxID=2268447 RepID=A0A367YWH5_9ACTN|nr:hypothetical protein [Desertihabitans brevis]RCK70087.1 hypothetical protein DT076_08835 [Desertihabitans brevis]